MRHTALLVLLPTLGVTGCLDGTPGTTGGPASHPGPCHIAYTAPEPEPGVLQVGPDALAFEYDAQGRLTVERHLVLDGVDPEGGPRYREDMAEELGYDADGRLVSRSVYLAGELRTRQTLEYDDDGRLVATRVNGEIASQYRYDGAPIAPRIASYKQNISAWAPP